MKSRSRFSLVVLTAASALLVLAPLKSKAIYDLYPCCETDLLACAPGCTDQANCPWNCWDSYLRCEHLFPYQGGGPNPDCGAFTHYRFSGIILRHPDDAQNFTIAVEPTSYAFATNVAGVVHSVHLYVGDWNGTNSVGTTTATGVDFYAVPLSVVSAYVANTNLGALPWQYLGAGTQDGAGYWGLEWTPPSTEAYVVDADTYDATLTNLFINRQGMVTNGGSAALSLVLPTPSRAELITPAALPDGSLMLRVVGPAAAALTLQSSTDLKNWSNGPVLTNFSGLAQIVEGPGSTSAHKFYRASFTPLPAPLTVQGLVNAPAGNATLFTVDNSLYVTNLSSSGQDGVSIALPANLAGVDVQLLPLDADNSLPVGAYIQEQLIGTGYGVVDGLLGTLTATKLGETNYELTADFSPIGDSQFTYAGVLDGTVVTSGSGTNGDPVGRTFIPTTYGAAGGIPYFDWPGAGMLQIRTGFYQVSALPVTPQKTNYTVSAFKIVTSGISSFAVLNENESLVYQGLTNTSLGHATIATAGHSLYVTNLSSSGQDGVSIALPPELTSYSVSWQELDPSGSLPVGASLVENGIGNAPGITNGLVFSTASTKTGAGQYAVTASFSNNSNIIDVAVYSAGALVTNVTGLSATLCVASDVGYDVDDTIKNQPKKTYPPNTTFTFSGRGSVLGDTLVLIPQTSPQISAISSIQLLASNIPAMVIVDESASGPFTQLQVLLPGETNAPYTATGKLGTPSPIIGGQVTCTVRAADAHWNLVPTVNDTISVTCTDPNSLTPPPGSLLEGVGQFTVSFTDSGVFSLDTISASDVSASGITPGTSSQFSP